MSLKKAWLLTLPLFLSGWPVSAQDPPKVELFGGYSYLRFKPGDSVGAVNLNGWNAALTGNLNNWLGLVADFSGQYGSSLGINLNAHSLLFGPRFSYRGHDRVTPFAHTLFGVTRSHASSSTSSASQTAFSTAVGGGIDVKVNDRLALRLLQADYLFTLVGQPGPPFCIAVFPPPPGCVISGQANNLHNARLSFGVSFRLGMR